MNQSIQEALLLMLVGMSTVFLLLGIVVWGGQGLIRLLNALARPEAPPPLPNLPDTLERKHLAVLTAAVAQVTQGQGRLVSARKL